jgi:hypothetical protein
VSEPLVAPQQHPLAEFLGQVVVLDTQGPLIYLGTLTEVLPAHFVLVNADVHDSNDSRATKDLYLVEVRDLGVRINRKRVIVAAAQIASASLLSDITD